jgi:hypothetical protein
MDVRIRPAALKDRERLSTFYERNRSDELPPPTTRDLLDAIRLGRCFVVEDRAGEILACSAHIFVTPESAKTYVGELTGTCVTTRLNGARPIRVHKLMLGLRVLHSVATMPTALGGASTSLITIVKASNERSLRGIRGAQFVEIPHRPAWLRFDELSWHGRDAGPDWTYFYATNRTARHLAEALIAVGLFSWKIELEVAGGPVTATLEGFHELRLAEADIRALAEGRQEVDWIPPPDGIAF